MPIDAASLLYRRVLTRTRQMVLAWMLAGMLVLLFMLRVALPSATHLTHGFSAYFTAARLVTERQEVAKFYDDAWFSAQTRRLGFAGAEDIFNVNPPLAALLFYPLAGFEPGVARVIWTALNVLFLGLALVVLLHVGRSSGQATAMGVALLVLFQPVRIEVQLGQAYALLLLLEAVLLWVYVSRHDAFTGLVLGLMLVLKTAGLALPLLLVGQRRWHAVGWLLLTVGGVATLSLPWVGIAAWQIYLALLVRFGAKPELAVTAYQTLPGLVSHLFSPDATWNRAPLFAAPGLALVLQATLALGMVGLTFWLTWQLDPADSRRGALAFAAWATLSIILSPVSQDYHYTLLLAPVVILLAYWRDARPGWAIGVVEAAGVLLVAAPLPYTSPALTTGGWTLLAYPKLYGALLLWAVAVYCLLRELSTKNDRLAVACEER